MTDLLYTEIEEDLRASVRDLLTDRASPAALLARVETAEAYDLKLWRTLAADLGVAGLAVPEEHGGHGASARELAVVAEELGRCVAPVPFLGSVVLATSALLAAADAPAAAELLPRLAAGDLIGALAVPLSTLPGAGFPTSVTAAVTGSDGTLTGRVGTVADASAAEVLIVPAAGPDGPGLYAVDASAATVTELTSLDLTRRVADVVLDKAPGRLVASHDQAVAALDQALHTGAGVLASEQVGITEWALTETVRYLKGRYQFGRPVGGFQSLKHRLADLYTDLVIARAAARYAADALANGIDVPIAVSVAQARNAPIAVHAAEEAVQLHGGIGMTWEHPAHLYLKRAKADEIALGTPGRHRGRLAGLVDLPS